MKQSIYNTALYLRLSRDDEGAGESNSIATQRMMLRRYAEQNNLFVVDEYTDLPGGERVSRFLWPVPVDLNQAKSLEYRYGEEVQAFDLK